MRIFIGREDALEALQGDLLGPSQYTIANLHGIGGVGKTTLKAEVFLRLQEAGAMIPVLHADENVARSDLAEFIAAITESFFQPWEGEPARFARVNRARARLRELKGRLLRERDAAVLDRGLKMALSGLARRALLAKRAPDLLPAEPPVGEPILRATVSMQEAAQTAQAAQSAVATQELTRTAPAGFTFQAPSAEWSRADQQDYEQAVAAWTRDREDQELLLDPLQAITRALFDDLVDYLYPAQSGLLDLLGGRRKLSQAPLRVLLAIDSYEALDAGLHDWLVVHVLPGLRRVHPDTGKRVGELVDLRLLLSGREALRDADPLRRWDAFGSRIREIDLGRFSEAEVGDYLEARGLPRSDTGRALAETQGLPYLLGLWCDSAGSNRAVAVARATSRIYWWKTPAQIRWLKAASFLDTLDRDRLAVVLADPGEAQDAYAWLASNGEVAAQSSSGGLAVHPVVRSLVRAGLSQESPAELAELERRADIAQRAATLRAAIGPATFGALLHLVPLRWFDPPLLRDLLPTEAEGLWRAAETLGGRHAADAERDGGRPYPEAVTAERQEGRPAPGAERQERLVRPIAEVPGALALTPATRDLLADYMRLAQPSAYHESLATLRGIAGRRTDAEEARREALLAQAGSRQGDATVARQRANSLEARVASLQADEHAAEDLLKRAELAVPDPDRVSRRAPWWAGSASGLLGAVASFGSLPLLGQGERLIGWSVGAALLVIALGCATRALWLPKPPSEQHVADARRAVDDAAAHLARLRADLAQALLEVSNAARLADQLQAEADELRARADRREPAFM